MKMLFTLATLLACAALGVASAGQSPASSNQVGQTSLKMSGTLTENEGKFFLTDDASRSTVEVRGPGLEKYAGEKVNLTGDLVPGATGSQDILIISEVSRKAAGVVTGKAAAAGVKSGLSKTLVIGFAGAGTAATVGTLYAINETEAPVSGR